MFQYVSLTVYSAIMSTYTSRIGFTNRRDRPHVVWVEPWAEDFTLLPGESLEIHLWSSTAQPGFHVDQWDHQSQVYVEGTDLSIISFAVIQNEGKLECGHQRQAAIDAGIQL
jgi:hypothetical protein